MNSIAFFNNRCRPGKTSLVYHLAWMFSELGVRVLLADLDPQANLTGMFLDEDRLEELWSDTGPRATVAGMVSPVFNGIGDIIPPHVEHIDDNIGLLAGDIDLSEYEETLAAAWPQCLAGDQEALRVITAMHHGVELAAREREADLILVDLAPNLGAINRAAMLTAQHMVAPLAPDLVSLEALRNLGTTLVRWQREWSHCIRKSATLAPSLPRAKMLHTGYVVMQPPLRLDLPVQATGRWMAQLPDIYRESLLDDQPRAKDPAVKTDPNCLWVLKHYPNLSSMALEARKPMFALRPADGAIGSQVSSVQSCYREFRGLARVIAERSGIALPE